MRASDFLSRDHPDPSGDAAGSSTADPSPELRTHTFSGSRLAARYFALQALACAGWWLALARWPAIDVLFAPGGDALKAFWLPDLVFVIGLSVIASWLAVAERAEAMVVGWLVTGALGYGAVFCLSWSARHDAGWWAVLAMVPAAFLSAVAAADLSGGVLRVFRPATRSSPRHDLLETTLQSLVMWAVFLGGIPLAIFALERKLGVPVASPSTARIACGGSLLIVTSALNLWSGLTMARLGRGTPLPLATARRLVTTGPYAYVRNPNVRGGLGQGLAAALLLGSWLVVAYVLAGGLMWQWLARPAEEADMDLRFGRAYEVYRSRVSCWWPRRSRLCR